MLFHHIFLWDTNLFPSSLCPHQATLSCGFHELQSMCLHTTRRMTGGSLSRPMVVLGLPAWHFLSDEFSSITLERSEPGYTRELMQCLCLAKRGYKKWHSPVVSLTVLTFVSLTCGMRSLSSEGMNQWHSPQPCLDCPVVYLTVSC